MSHPTISDEESMAAAKTPSDAERLVGEVRKRYGRIATHGTSCCAGGGPTAVECEPAASETLGYEQEELTAVPAEADLGLGCGAPIPHLDLQSGEVVLDLGSGGGLDALLAAREVGSEGRVIGVDMTPEMIELARENAAKAGVEQVEYRQGRLEALPVDDGSVDAVTSNCVINLVPDKARVFREIARVLRPGGRMVIADIVLDGRLPEVLESDLLAWVGCVSGAEQRDAYFAKVAAAGLGGIEVLRDVDFLAALGPEPPEEVTALLKALGVQPDQLRGKVRSLTYRAVKT